MNDSRIPFLVDRFVNTHGWKHDRILPNVVTRWYDTAVGPKPASVWFTVCRETGAVYFWPEYQSEGRNAAAACSASAWVMPDLSNEQAFAVVDKFVQDLDTCVSQTFAARLLSSGVCA